MRSRPTTAALILRCAMTSGCPAAVAYIDAKGFVYCATHGVARKSSHSCRKLRASEMMRLERGETISYGRHAE
jgi:hypothetical protein